MKNLEILQSVEEFEQKIELLPDQALCLIRQSDGKPIICYKNCRGTKDKSTVRKNGVSGAYPDRIVRYRDYTHVRYDDSDIVYADQAG